MLLVEVWLSDTFPGKEWMSSSSPPRDEPADDAWLRLALIQQLESLQVAGVLEMAPPIARQLTSAPPLALPDGPDMESSMKSSTNSQSLFNDSMTAQTDMGLDERRRQLNVLQHEVSSCTCCDELVDNRTKTVFGVGNPQARLVFFGEAPGADEDQQGEPFVGRAGKLLNDIISQGMGLTRSDVYIMNVVKCRPPGNRNPTSAEAVNCRPFFERQFEIIRPEFICCLGAVAAATLLAVNVSIGSLRGCLHNYRGIRVLATYHPAYLLRNPDAKKEVWKDIQLLMAEMGLTAPGKK